MESTVTIPSTRVYLDQLKDEYYASLMATFYWFNRAKEELYNRKYDAEFLGGGVENETAYISQWLAERGVRPKAYYFASLMNAAGGMVSSQKELQKQYQEAFKEREAKRKGKIKSIKRRITLCRKAKESLIARSKRKKEGLKPSAPYVPKDFEKILPPKDRGDENAIYLYECWLDRETSILQARLAQVAEKGRLDALRQERTPRRVTFGGRPSYKLKDTSRHPLRCLARKPRPFAHGEDYPLRAL